MEGESSSAGKIIPGGHGQFQDPQGSIRVHHNQTPQLDQYGSIVQDDLPLRVTDMPMADKCGIVSHSSPGGRQKSNAADDDEMNSAESTDGHAEVDKGMQGSSWQRIKWTDQMVRLLITALSYIGEEVSFHNVGTVRRKPLPLQKIGKWRCVSRAMVERGYHVSPQQCEDKFNDLNKRYKRLNDILGRGTSCNVVENPNLLNVMDIPEKEKEDVRKILNSKHLYYEEMCSYHNKNRLHLPPDPALQHFLQLVIWGRDGRGTDDPLDNLGAGPADCYKAVEACGKRLKQIDEAEDLVAVGNPWKYFDCNSTLDAHPQNHIDFCSRPEGSKIGMPQHHQIATQALELEEKKLQMQVQTLKLKEQQFQMEVTRWKQDTELEKMRLENERMKLENKRMAMELKRKKLSGNYN